jgi:hypothetical protein
MGWGPLLMTRVGGLVSAVFIFSVLVGALALVPFLVIGAWKRRRDAVFGPYFGYAALLFAFSAIVSAVHVPGGTFIHSAVALAPHAYVLALEGIVIAVAWIGRRRRTWKPDRAARIFVSSAVGFGVLAAVWGSFSVHGSWDVKRQRAQVVAHGLADAGALPDDRVMSIDASGTRYWTGHGGVVLVNDPIDTVESVAQAYDIRWLVLETADGVPATTEILVNGRRPPWVGAAVMDTGDVAVYPVCTRPEDLRCVDDGSNTVRRVGDDAGADVGDDAGADG